MNSEMYIEKDNIKKFLKVKKQRKYKKLILLLFLTGTVIAASLSAVVFMYFTSVPKADYLLKNRFTHFYSTDDNQLYCPAFARNLAVVDADSSEAQNFPPGAGLICRVGGERSLFSKNAFKKMQPASITKIMTALVALKYGNLSDEVVVGEEVYVNEKGTSMAGLNPGDRLTLEQLLYGMLLPSGNDAAKAIAVHVGGTQEHFVEMMNQEAQALLAVDTHFTNPHGLSDDEHYTTAYDLYLIFNEAIKYPEFRTVAGSKEYKGQYLDKTGNTVSALWKNSNVYLKDASELDAEMTQAVKLNPGISIFAGKTGTTAAAGKCLIVGSSYTDGSEYIAVVLKADVNTADSLYKNMSRLLNKIAN